MLEKAWMRKHARNVPVAGLIVVSQGNVVQQPSRLHSYPRDIFPGV